MEDYASYDATALAELVRKKHVSPSELLSEATRRAEAAQAELNCFSAMFPEVAEELTPGHLMGAKLV